MFSRLLCQTASIKRKTDVIVTSQTIAATLTVTYQPNEASYLSVTLGGSPGAGTVTITGLVSGSSTPETLTFADALPQRTANKFTSVTAATTTGFSSGGTIEIRARALEGNPIYSLQTIHAATKCRIYTKRSYEKDLRPVGVVETKLQRIFTTVALLRGDTITVSSIDYEAAADSEPKLNASTVHHYETDIDVQK